MTLTMIETLKKYKLIVMPLVLVVIFDLLLLVSNFILSAELESASVNINIAGRQRMLSQQIGKELALVHLKLNVQSNESINKNQLLTSIALFDKTLSAFMDGGETMNAHGVPVFIDKLTDPESINTLKAAEALWRPVYKNLTRILASKPLQVEPVEQLLVNSESSYTELLRLMNNLTNQLEQDAKYKTYLLRTLQSIVVVMVILSFFMASIRLIRRERYYKALMENSTDIVLGMDVHSGNVTFISASVHSLLHQDASFYIGKPAGSLFTSSSEKQLLGLLDKVKRTGLLDIERCDVELVQQDGTIIQAEMIMKLCKSEDSQSLEVMGDIRDITERKKAELQLLDMAHTDTVTGLPNRASFELLAQKALEKSECHDELKMTLLFVDLDGFKSVNDQYGHQVGDAVLEEVGVRIKSCLRQSDEVSRFGGDEFVILLEGISDRDTIELIGKKIIQLLSTEIVVDDYICEIGASIGVAISPEHGSDIIKLIKKADNAMYAVKQSGKNGLSFSPD